MMYYIQHINNGSTDFCRGEPTCSPLLQRTMWLNVFWLSNVPRSWGQSYVSCLPLLYKHGYPPVDRNEVYKEIFEQAENFKRYQTV